TKNGAAFASGNAANFRFTPDDNGTYVVTLTATDKDGGAGKSSRTILVDNVTPTIGSISGPIIAVRGQPLTYTANWLHPGKVDQASELFTWEVTNGAGQAVAGGSGTLLASFSFTPTAAGTDRLWVTVVDKDRSSSLFTEALSVKAAALEADPTDPSKTAL